MNILKFIFHVFNELLYYIDFNFYRIVKLIILIFCFISLFNIVYPIILFNISSTYYTFKH